METDILTKATILYEAGSYKNAIDECVHFLESDQFKDYDKKSEVYEIMALCSLFETNTPLNDKANRFFYKLISLAANEATNSQRISELDKNVYDSLFKWEEKALKYHLNKLKSNFCMDSYKEYLPIWVKFSEISYIYSQTIAAVCKEKSFERPDHFKTFEDNYDREVEYEVACEMFDKTRYYFENNNSGDKDFLLDIIKRTLDQLGTERLLLHIDSKGETDYKEKYPDLYLKALKKAAEIDYFEVSAIVYSPNGCMYILNDIDSESREKALQKLSRLYEKIQQLDPDFIAPTLPSATGLIAQSSNNKEKTGGCYIATAVYGSYDCPQVWTLRRYRDNTLAKTWFGRAFIRTYYFFSPTLVKLFGKTNWFRLLWKPYLDKKVKRLHDLGVEDTPYNDKRR